MKILPRSHELPKYFRATACPSVDKIVDNGSLDAAGYIRRGLASNA